MSADGFLFITEELRDAIVEKYSEFTKTSFSLEVPKNFEDCWDPSDYPDAEMVKLFSKDRKHTHNVKFSLTFFIANEGFGRFINYKIETLEVIPI